MWDGSGLFAFKNFQINMSYPKKIVDSYIENEYLEGRTNFRYKKVNILMGANATGKTSIGKMLMEIFNFMDKKESDWLTEAIRDTGREASFCIDFVVEGYLLYRVTVMIAPKSKEKYTSSDIRVTVRVVEIKPKDSYETCVKRLEAIPGSGEKDYRVELEKIEGLSWLFQYPMDSRPNSGIYTSQNTKRYVRILTLVLQALDPSIKSVEKINAVKNTYVIRTEHRDIVMQDGKVIDTNILSSGTRAGIEIAGTLTSMLNGDHGFYYCDEKFSYIHSDIEKAFLTVMIECLKDDTQLFFTTHNMDILDIPLPKHSFSFLQRDYNDPVHPIKCVSASKYLKRNTDSLRSAVDNDLFSAAPKVDLIYEIAEISTGA